MKKHTTIILVLVALMLAVTACGTKSTPLLPPPRQPKPPKVAEPTTVKPVEIIVVSREEGSGTRGAFVELTGVEAKNEAGDKVDNTYIEAVIQNSTNGVMMTVANEANAIGYISLGSLNDTVKAVQIDGVEATAENVKNGSYKIARPFNIAYKAGLDEASQDLLDFILSEEGQKSLKNAVISPAKLVLLSRVARLKVPLLWLVQLLLPPLWKNWLKPTMLSIQTSRSKFRPLVHPLVCKAPWKVLANSVWLHVS